MAATKLSPKTYEGLTALLGNKDAKKVENNTYIYKAVSSKGEVTFDLTLHGNTIASWSPDGLITIRTCGYQTMTTKARLNQFCSASITQKDYNWYVNGRPFVSGMKIKVSEVTGMASVASYPES